MMTPLLIHLDTALPLAVPTTLALPGSYRCLVLSRALAHRKTAPASRTYPRHAAFGAHVDHHPGGGEPLHLWSARDALVLKALTLAVAPQLALSPRCMHAKGHGGVKAAVLMQHSFCNFPEH